MKNTTSQPLFETIESRNLMSVSVQINPSHQLIIQGSNVADTVQVNKSGDQLKIMSMSAGESWKTQYAPLSAVKEIKVYGNKGNDALTIGQTVTLTAYLFGGDGHDSLFGGGGADKLFGEKGIDLLDGRQGNDVMFGGADNDTIADGSLAGYGDDLIDGEGGTDHVTYAGHQSAVQIKLDVSNKSGALGKGEVDSIFHVEQVTGTDYDDKIWGNNSANLIFAGKGNDVVYGQGGDDMIFGQEGNDQLYGGLGKDVLIGNVGNDLFFANGDGSKDQIWAHDLGVWNNAAGNTDVAWVSVGDQTFATTQNLWV